MQAKTDGSIRSVEREGPKTKDPFYFFSCGSGVWNYSRTCWRKTPGHKDDPTEEKNWGLHGNFQGRMKRTW